MTPTGPGPRFDSPAQEAYLNLWRTYDRLREFEDRAFAEFDLTAQQYNVLRLLRAARPDAVPTAAIADKLITRAPDVTRILDKLEARHLIRRQRPDSDRRTVLVGITERGLAMLDAVAGPLAECHTRQLGHLSADEVAELVRLLKLARGPHEKDGSNWK